ncbi:MAG: glycosyltransferase [Alphaproteobacteria bacterium]
MRTVLFAAELGYGFGHVSRLIAVADALEPFGYRPVFAVGDVCETFPILGHRPWPVLQAPVTRALPHLNVTDGRHKVGSFADILWFVGYGKSDMLTPMVRAWDHLFGHVRPDLIVCDFSPTVALAARGTIPVVAIGDGFSQPPSTLPEFPALRDDAPPQARQADLLQVVADVQTARGRPVPPTLPSIVAGDREFVCILPEFDPYGRHVPRRTAGPLRKLPEKLPPPEGGEPTIFAYLSGSYEKLSQIGEGLAKSGARGVAYLRNASPKVMDAFDAIGVHALREVLPPAEFRAAVGRARCVIHHAGVGTSQDMLALGRAQILVPMTFEQQLTSDTLYRFRVGGRLRQGVSSDALATAIRSFVDSSDYSARAELVAANIAERSPAPAMPRIVEACRTLAGEI